MVILRFIALLALLLPIGACAINTKASTYLVETKGPYTLDTGDVVRITVYGEDSLSGSYRVDDSGAIAFPLVGVINARGFTTKDTAARIAASLARSYIRNPNVSIEVESYRPFFIQGEVSSSGQYPYVFGMSVRAAVSTAGGFTDTADRDRALVYRLQGSEMVKGTVDLDFPIYPGDTIVILDRWL